MDMENFNKYIKNHAKQLFLPYMMGDENKITKSDDPYVIMQTVNKYGHREKIISYGYIEDDQFEHTVDQVVHRVADGFDRNVIYYKDYNNGTFNFKIYVFDEIGDINGKKLVLRSVHAFFLEPKLHDIYEFRYCLPHFPMPTNLFKLGVIDLENDNLTKSLIDRVMMLLERLKYKEKEDDVNVQEFAQEMAIRQNYRLHAQQLFVPLLEGFKIKEQDNPQIVFNAINDNLIIEQLVSDGYIGEGEFEDRIKLVMGNVKNWMKNDGREGDYIYYKDYSNGVFDFKIYVLDIITNRDNERKVSRQFIAFFVEPKMHDFYQFAYALPPYTMPTELLKPGVIDLENDAVTDYSMKRLIFLLDNLKY